MKAIDLHIHSNHSSDATSTLDEIAQIASEKKMDVIAITNHIPELAGHIWYGDCDSIIKMKQQRDALEDQHQVRILIGAEIDVIDTTGALAYPSTNLSEFEFIVSGVHRYPITTRGTDKMHFTRPFPNQDSMHYGIAEYYRITEGILRNPHVDVLAHPLYAFSFLFTDELKPNAVSMFPEIYIREIMKLAAMEGKAVELNAAQVHLMNELWFQYGDEFGVQYSIGSDSHKPQTICDVRKSLEVIEKYHIGEERMIEPPVRRI